MKNAIIKAIEEKIETNEMEYASMYIVEQKQLSLPDDKRDETEIAKARLAMTNCEERITWLRELHAKELSA